MSGLWGGRFEEGPSALLSRFNDSFSFDHELLADDVEGSVAWAGALFRAGVLSAEEHEGLRDALGQVPVPDSFGEHEDVHAYVEAMLRASLGPLAGKLHTGRSRNDQVATDLRLWLMRAFRAASSMTGELIVALARSAVAEAATPMPGYTHMKQAEPVTFGHWCLAYVEMLRRDVSRLCAAAERADECPLGSGALSGTPLPIDRESLAKVLGFARPTANSLDAVSDRDGGVEYLFACSLLLTHLSRMAEDLIFFSSDEVRMVALHDSVATGSSRMPQKKNPDVLELVRGHAARSIGELTGLLALLKGLPLAYDKDLQLDKEPLFRMNLVMRSVLPVLTRLVESLHLDRSRMRELASGDLLLATELADAMSARGVPFREAHHVVSMRVGEALRGGRSLQGLGPTEEITASDLEALDVDRALAKRSSTGGTAPTRVREAAESALAAAGISIPSRKECEVLA